MTSISTVDHPTPGACPAPDPVSLFNDGRLMLRAVDARKGKWHGWETKPVTVLSPRCRNPLSEDLEKKSGFLARPWVVTMLRPVDAVKLVWAYKRDAWTDDKGDCQSSFTQHKPLKKITDLTTFDTKMEEMHRKSIFRLTTSGRIDSSGYLLHQSSQRKNTDKTYPEVICQLNFGLMHCGYLLDFTRESTFERVAGMMQNILLLELEDNASGHEEFRQPVQLSVFDRERGALFPPLKLQRHEVEAISANARAFSEYAHAMGQDITLFKVLSQSGGDRFLQLLIHIPDSVKAVAETEKNLDQIKILTTPELLKSSSLPELLAAIEHARLLNVNLPVRFLTDIVYTRTIYRFEIAEFKDLKKYFCQEMDLLPADRLQQLESMFARQAVLCRKALTNRLFVPILLNGNTRAGYNPLVTCLLIAHGTRINFQNDTNQGFEILCLLMAARYFCQKHWLTGNEVRIIRHEILWQLLCSETTLTVNHFVGINLGQMAPPEKTLNNFNTLIGNLKTLLAGQSAATANWAEDQCRELIGKEIFDRFYLYNQANGQKLQDYLQSGLSPQRFNDEQLMDHIRYMTTIPLPEEELGSPIEFCQKLYRVNDFCVIRLPDKEAGQSEWLNEFLTTPPTFVQSELDRIGHYAAITRIAGRHYYQNPHPNKAKFILAGGAGIKTAFRKVHGLDHALRTQLATEFITEVLPRFHPPFKELVKSQPLLPELLSIAELYHDAVAEDEHKDVEERRAAELFQRDMQGLHRYPDELIDLVARALKNKNSNKMQPVTAPFTSDQQCPAEELLLRQVLRFGDTVDILRVIPSRADFPTIRLTPGATEPENNHHFNPEAIELLGVVNNPEFTLLIQAALLSFRNLACITGGWHHEDTNPFTTKYQLPVDNDQRRLLIEQASDPQLCLRENLDDLVRLAMAEKAGISPCLNDHPKRSDNPPMPDCWDPQTGSAGVYRKLHNEQELRQIALPQNMTLAEKIVVAADELNGDLDNTASWLSPDIRNSMQSEIARLQQNGIRPAIGTPSQSELEQIFRQPECPGARILNERGLAVVSTEHEGRTVYRMKPKCTGLQVKRCHDEFDNDGDTIPALPLSRLP
ncbi:hypothetical protein [Endozoicomonas sp. SESOKO1]|uniref:hypothetical protein n=1 Tax=Endozoicomonas sp. SESOKO1 TaxID=2828742 RepID=UPI00214738F3|nr:hypothetical protein [Endozoicomonas sp. SESOKO1]